jgi:hypothetical protein
MGVFDKKTRKPRVKKSFSEQKYKNLARLTNRKVKIPD